MEHEGRVLMIVRTSGPRSMNLNGNARPYNRGSSGGGDDGGGGGGGGGDDDAPMIRNGNDLNPFTGNYNFGPMEAEFRHQQLQRQRMQLLSMAIFLCFMVLFFDNRAESSRQNRTFGSSHLGNRNNGNGGRAPGVSDAANDSLRLERVHALQDKLWHEPGYSPAAPSLNTSGIYSGAWKSLTQDEFNTMKENVSDIVPFLKIDRDAHLQQYTQPVDTGHAWFFLKMKPPASKELADDVAYATGQIVIYDEQTSLAATIMPVQGVFLRKLGKMTLFGNAPDASVQLLYKRNVTLPEDALNASRESPIPMEELVRRYQMDMHGEPPTVEGIPFTYHSNEYGAVDISPPRYTYITRFRNSDSFSDQCVSVVEMQMMNESAVTGSNHLDLPDPDEEDEVDDGVGDPFGLRHMRLVGTLASENCGLYMKVEARFREENLDLFFSKASHYAVLMTFIAMAEIYFLLRQLQISNTQATAAKVSLLTIGQQAVVDSYLCLGHLTVGIVSKNVFTAFASVAFVKLIIFSVFEMRYLLIIWKARRPQGFSEGWLTLRRELTTLYSRFYLSLLMGLITFYNFWGYLPWLVFLAYSFWVPQMVHNVHREVRNPFDLGYLYGISTLRMFLPLYFYGCPSNFLTAFPMSDSKVNPSFCGVLVVWMVLQVGILSLQQKYGPRFFVPARFLPVKYNYERRINVQEMSLLRNSSNDDDSNDCVICMVELDMSARDYMIAPCDHVFHRECLQGWMQVKMECPTCRCVLPEP